jgi:carbonic anhydrase
MKMRGKISQALLSATILLFFATLAQASEAHWSYEGENGPAYWGELSQEFGEAIGDAQSPIDLDINAPKQTSFYYRDGFFTVINNGHTIQAAPDDKNESSIVLDGTRYYLQQLHFHTPSEHTVKGMAFPMEAHFVNCSDEGRFAVVSVFIDDGKENEAIKTIWGAVPKEKNVGAGIKNTFRLTALLPTKLDGFGYQGSFTTPPTTEGVLWIVLNEHIEASAGQVKWFTDLIGKNARPVQPSNGRTLTVFQGEQRQ